MPTKSCAIVIQSGVMLGAETSMDGLRQPVRDARA